VEQPVEYWEDSVSFAFPVPAIAALEIVALRTPSHTRTVAAHGASSPIRQTKVCFCITSGHANRRFEGILRHKSEPHASSGIAVSRRSSSLACTDDDADSRISFHGIRAAIAGSVNDARPRAAEAAHAEHGPPHQRGARSSLPIIVARDGCCTCDSGSEFIETRVATSSAVIALIGRNWVRVTDRMGRRRIDDSSDVVRVEIAAAIRHRIPLFPVLVQSAPVLRPEELAEDIRTLAVHSPLELSPASWAAGVDRLLKELDKAMKK
jgi:hypothetical protein